MNPFDRFGFDPKIEITTVMKTPSTWRRVEAAWQGRWRDGNDEPITREQFDRGGFGRGSGQNLAIHASGTTMPTLTVGGATVHIDDLPILHGIVQQMARRFLADYRNALSTVAIDAMEVLAAGSPPCQIAHDAFARATDRATGWLNEADSAAIIGDGEALGARDLARRSLAALLIEVRRDALQEALDLVRSFRSTDQIHQDICALDGSLT